MFGITGLYQFHAQPVESQDLWRMTRVLTDHSGGALPSVWTDGCVGLGFCGSQAVARSLDKPGVLASEDGQLAIVADARIDNRKEIVDKLGWQRRPASQVSDSMLILGTYGRWRERCCEHLLGDFAFALWDERQQQLFCGRDHLGVRPLYYAIAENAVAFSSDIKALLSLAWTPPGVNEVKVADYLMQMYDDEEATFYQGIRRLPPAHTLKVTADGVSLRKYWDVDPDQEVRYSSDQEYAEAYGDLFTQAVQCRISSAQSVGSFLSGGLDSSSVTCVARSILEADGSQPLDTFSLIFDEERQCDERQYIEAVLEQGGLRPHFVHGDRINPFDCMDQMLQQVGEPFFTPNLYLYWHLYSAAQREGSQVVLDGLFGDTVVSHGSRYITELAETGRWITLAKEVNTTSRVLGSRRKYYPRLMAQFALSPLLLEPLQRSWRALTSPGVPPHISSTFINRDFLRDIGWMKRARDFGEANPRTPLSVKEEHTRELRSGTIPGAIEIATRAAAAFGLTPCFPFTDRRLVEFCLAVPPTQKYHQGWTRVIARRGLRQYLPEKIYNRYGKTYLQRVLYRSLFILGKEQADSLVYDRLPIAAPYLNVPGLQQAYRQMVQTEEPADRSEQGKTTLAIWNAMLLTRWLELEKEEISNRRTLFDEYARIAKPKPIGYQGVQAAT